MQLDKERILSDDTADEREADGMNVEDTQVDTVEVGRTQVEQLEPFEDADKDDEMFKNQGLRLITPYSSDEEDESNSNGISAYLDVLNSTENSPPNAPSKSFAGEISNPIRRRIKKHVTIQADQSDEEELDSNTIFQTDAAIDGSNGQKASRRSLLLDEDD